jgi:hypothetical protein
MRAKYCGESCQKAHFKQHIQTKICTPFYFIDSGEKRTAQQSKEDEERAESEYVKLYSAYKREGEDPIYVSQLEELFGRMSNEAREKYRDGLPCHDGVDPLTRDDIASLEEDNRIYLMVNNIKYCYNLDLLIGYIRSMQARDEIYGIRTPVNPISRQPFSEDELTRIGNAGELRKLTLWTKVRESRDTTILSETFETLLNMYGIPPHIIEGAKSDRLKREWKTLDLTDFSYLVNDWLLLKALGMQFAEINWKIINKFNSFTEGFEKNLFENANDFKRKFWKAGHFRKFLKDHPIVSKHFYKYFFTSSFQRNSKKDFFENLQLALSTFFLRVDWQHRREVILRYGESIEQRYNQAFQSVELINIPKDRNLINKTWLVISSYWQDAVDTTTNTTTTTEYELPWPGEPAFNSQGEATLVVTIRYEPPTIDIEYNFHGKLKRFEPPEFFAAFDGTELMKPLEQFRKIRYRFNWPADLRNIDSKDYKMRIGIIYSPNVSETYFLDSVAEPPLEKLYEYLSKHKYDSDIAGPLIGKNVKWEVIISIIPRVDEVYEKGIQFLSENWSQYREDRDMDYGDFEWEKLPYKPKDGKYWVHLFPTSEDLERASLIPFFEGLNGEDRGDWNIRNSKNKLFWTTLLGVKKINSKVIAQHIENIENAKQNRLQKEWAETAEYNLLIHGYIMIIQIVKKKGKDVYQSYQKAFSRYLNDLSREVIGLGKRWISISSSWRHQGKNASAKNKGTFKLPWPSQMPKLTGPRDSVYLDVRVENNTPSRVYNFVLRDDTLEKSGVLRIARSMTRPDLGKITNWQGNRELQTWVRDNAFSFWNDAFSWERWPSNINMKDYQTRVVFEFFRRKEAGPIILPPDIPTTLIFDNIRESPFVSIIQHLSVFIEDGALDNVSIVNINLIIERKETK